MSQLSLRWPLSVLARAFCAVVCHHKRYIMKNALARTLNGQIEQFPFSRRLNCDTTSELAFLFWLGYPTHLPIYYSPSPFHTKSMNSGFILHFPIFCQMAWNHTFNWLWIDPNQNTSNPFLKHSSGKYQAEKHIKTTKELSRIFWYAQVGFKLLVSANTF